MSILNNIEKAAETGNRKTIFRSLKQRGVYGRGRGPDFRRKMNAGLRGASRGGHIGWVKFFILFGATNFYPAINEAAAGGHRDLIFYLFQKWVRVHSLYRIQWWKLNVVRSIAKENGHDDLVEYLEQEIFCNL